MPEAERSIRRACRVGGALGLAIFVFVLLAGRLSLLQAGPVSDFYDAQGRALLHGDLAIDPDVLGIEAFFHDGRAYMYQPPFPALLRFPVLVATDHLDGRLSQLSMLLAAVVLVFAVEECAVGLRRALRPGLDPTAAPPAGRLERWLVGLVAFVTIGGASPTYLASRAWVYHEAALWGLAWAMAAFAAILHLHRRPTPGRAIAAGSLTLLCLMSRASVGAGPVVALALLGLLWLLPASRRGDGPSPRLSPSLVLLAAVLPCVAFAALNLAKFGTLASIPFEEQGFTLVDEGRQQMLDENGGTLFGGQFVPTTALHYLRPDGIRFTGTFPFVDFPPPGGPVVGDVTFDLVDRTASIPASLPFLFVGAALGATLLARRRRWSDGSDRASAAVLLAGALAGSLTILPFGYIAHRYQADVLPLLTLGCLVAVQGVVGRPQVRLRARLLVVGAVALVVLTTWATVGLALLYQRLYAPNVEPALLESLLSTQRALGRDLHARTVERLPPAGEPGELVALEGCSALYLWDTNPVGSFRTTGWIPVERGVDGGHVKLDARLADLHPERRYPVVVRDDPVDPLLVWVQATAPGRIRAGFDGPGLPTVGRDQPIRGRTSLDVVLDPSLGELVVRLGDELLLTGFLARGSPIDHLEIGSSGGRPELEATLPGARELPPDPTDLCRSVTGS